MNVRFGRPNVTVSEDVGVFMMCVLKDRDTIGPVTVTLSSAEVSATENSGRFETKCRINHSCIHTCFAMH